MSRPSPSLGESDGQWIREARDELGLDQVSLAELAGISRRSLAAYERGETMPPPPKRVAIEQALRRERERLGYAEPMDSLETRIRRLEAINLRILQLVEETLDVIRRRMEPPPSEEQRADA